MLCEILQTACDEERNRGRHQVLVETGNPFAGMDFLYPNALRTPACLIPFVSR
jgi:hypothetical protein